MEGFAAATGVRPGIVVYYSGWNETFRTGFAEAARSDHSYVLVQMQPSGVSLASIATGGSDAYLRSYADEVRAFGSPVMLSFGHEMNGNWYPWGYGHVSPSVFVAAWRHIVQIFHEEDAYNAVWTWTVTSENRTLSPLQPWWPGAHWVNLVGVDGYYYHSTDTFSSVFGQTIAQIRTFSQTPVVLAEAAVGTTPDRESQISALISAVYREHLVGMSWFDTDQNGSIFRQDWRLENDPVALAAFRSAIRRYR